MDYEIVIGIEVHCELKTETKIFSSANNSYGAVANTQTSAFDFASPGAKPVLDEDSLKMAIIACAALECDINTYLEFDRKNYFYPDIPKGYQITQQRLPLGVNGKVEIAAENGCKEVKITRIHMEEDTGKSIHVEEDTLLDFNRAGSPLIEIVSDASMRTPKEAVNYVENLRAILLFSGVSDVKMEEGSMRCDANISLRRFGEEAYGIKVEVKNINSISKLEKALLYEVERQTELLNSNESVQMETRRFDDLTGTTVSMRDKEDAHDYRYHHEPNIMPLVLTEAYLQDVVKSLPKLPKQRRQEYIDKYKMSEYDAHILTLDVEISDMFDVITNYNVDYKMCANWLMGDISSYLNKNKVSLSETALTAENLVDLVTLITEGIISTKLGKEIIQACLENNVDVKKYVEEHDLVQISDDGLLEKIVEEVLQENEQSVIDYRNGKDRAFKYLIGQVMKKTHGKANPKLVTEIVRNKL